MPQIVLTEEQSRIVAQAAGPVEVRSAEGKLLGAFEPLSPKDLEFIEICKQRRAHPSGPGYSHAEVRARIQKLEEISRGEPMDRARVRELLRRMRAGEEL
jgi:hypothetical protein